jgi:hypothetical protein
MTITGGQAIYGGGVNNAGTLTLDGVNVGFNAASGGSSVSVRGWGGGSFNQTGVLDVEDSTISLNQPRQARRRMGALCAVSW